MTKSITIMGNPPAVINRKPAKSSLAAGRFRRIISPTRVGGAEEYDRLGA
jgi:hypothetical protein